MVCAMSFAEQLRGAMAERGMTGRQLARRVPCHPSLVCHFRNGRKRPSTKMAALFDVALGVGGELIEAARADGALPDRRSVLAGGGLLAGALLVGPEVADRLDWIARHPPAVDVAAVVALADVLAGQRRADDLFGSAVMLRPVMAQLSVVENLLCGRRAGRCGRRSLTSHSNGRSSPATSTGRSATSQETANGWRRRWSGPRRSVTTR